MGEAEFRYADYEQEMGMMIRAIITGATGMVGEGVLHDCLQHPDVEHVLVLGRKACGVSHPKMAECLVSDFHNLSAIASQLIGYNACFFCLGVSSVGMNERDYYRATYTLTLHMATLLSQYNGGMTFCYVSGAGTDSTELGRSMWARVKGKTENDLMALPFGQVYNFRPGYIHPTKGLKNTKRYYRYLSWLYPILRVFFSSHLLTLRQLALAMIHSVDDGKQKRVLEVKDILALAKAA